ncbi:type VI secretion system protein TssA [Bordetella genomosp. 8]|uniref:type VI secretion system protein TssA n=1 Tax=Bordetella genomosp. 8 TaxID=1416806 RepID=UPI0012FE1A62|nr:type VI secretion system protein TssA [Bordetella genomosp. 8]
MSVQDVLTERAAHQDDAAPPEAAQASGLAHGVARDVPGKDAGHARQRAGAMDLDAYLGDIAPDAPCGPDLQYDADYIELTRLMQGTTAVEYGDMRIDAADPDWRSAGPAVLKLLARTRDLRVLVWNVRCLTGLHGHAGLLDGLALLEACIERHWEHLHPALDEDNDPVERLNILVELDDIDGLLRQARLAALVRAAGFGAVTPRDIELVTGELTPRQGETAPEPEAIEAAVHAASRADIETCLAWLEQACASLERIDDLLSRRVEPGHALAVEKLPRVLRHAARVMRDYLSRHPDVLRSGRRPAGQETDMDGPAADDEASGAHGGMHDGIHAGTHAGADGDIRCRDDVARLLDRICEYYAQQEPGSPVPVLLQRAKGLIPMNFLELMSELAPQGSAEIGILLGIRPEVSQPGIDPSEAYSTH